MRAKEENMKSNALKSMYVVMKSIPKDLNVKRCAHYNEKESPTKAWDLEPKCLQSDVHVVQCKLV